MQLLLSLLSGGALALQLLLKLLDSLRKLCSLTCCALRNCLYLGLMCCSNTALSADRIVQYSAPCTQHLPVQHEQQTMLTALPAIRVVKKMGRFNQGCSAHSSLKAQIHACRVQGIYMYWACQHPL